jgi:hypothetical protein
MKQEQERRILIDGLKNLRPNCTPEVYDLAAYAIQSRLAELNKPSEDLVCNINHIFDAYMTESDSGKSYSISEEGRTTFVAEISSLFNGMVSKEEMYEFVAWMLWENDTNLISLNKPIQEFYNDFKNGKK